MQLWLPVMSSTTTITKTSTTNQTNASTPSPRWTHLFAVLAAIALGATLLRPQWLFSSLTSSSAPKHDNGSCSQLLLLLALPVKTNYARASRRCAPRHDGSGSRRPGYSFSTPPGLLVLFAQSFIFGQRRLGQAFVRITLVIVAHRCAALALCTSSQ